MLFDSISRFPNVPDFPVLNLFSRVPVGQLARGRHFVMVVAGCVAGVGRGYLVAL